MFDDKVQRFSIRKLSVGAASVLIGITFLNGGNQVKADTVDANNKQDNQAAESNKAVETDKVDQVVVNANTEETLKTASDAANNASSTKDQATNSDSEKGQNSDYITLDTAQTAKTDKSEADLQTKDDQSTQAANKNVKAAALTATEDAEKSTNTVNENQTYNVTIDTVNDASEDGSPVTVFNRSTGKWEYKSINLKDVTDKTAISGIEQLYTIPGYKLLNSDALFDYFKLGQDLGTIKDTDNLYIDPNKAKDKDINLTLHYAPLSDIKVLYQDEATGHVLASAEFPSWKMTVESYHHAHGDDTYPDANKYEAHAIEIPGYELTSAPYIDGKYGEYVQSKDNPNYQYLIFKYKKDMTNDDSIATIPADSTAPNFGANIDGGWNSIPGLFYVSGVKGTKVDGDNNGDVEQKYKDLIDRYEKQGSSYTGMSGKLYNDDYYNYLYYGSSLYLVPNKPVTVQYVDEDGNALAPEDTISFNHNNPDQTNNGINEKEYWTPAGTWTTKPKEFDGYHLVKTRGAETGNFTVFNYITTYVYAKNGTDVRNQQEINTSATVHYEGAGDLTPADNVQNDFKFVYSGDTYDSYTNKELNKGEWNADSHSYNEVKVPEIDGYHTEISVVPSSDLTVTREAPTVVVNVKYVKNGTEVKDQETKESKQTVNFVDENGNKLADSVVSPIFNYEFSGDTYDAYTGKKLSDGTWNATSHTFDTVSVPVINGYVAVSGFNRENGKVVAGGLTSDLNNLDVTANVVYKKVGSIIPVDPEGHKIPDAPTPGYPNDPEDPTKITPNEPVPNVPGYTPSVPSVTPPDPTKDTNIVYNQDKGSVAVIFFDDTDNTTIPGVGFNSGNVAGGTKVDYNPQASIDDLEKQGYVYVSTDGTLPNEIEANKNITVTVHMKHGTQPIDPEKPGRPGEPINPNDPNGPKWPEGTDKKAIDKDVTRTIKFVDGSGKEIAKSIDQTVHFTAKGVIDKVTGKWVTPLEWTGEQKVDGVNVPVVDNYHVVSISKDGDGLTKVTGVELTYDDKGYTVTVSYNENGKIIPVDPSGKPIPGADVPSYPTDPTDPSKVVPNEPVPNVPGYTPEVPTVTPADPGKDTPVPYTPKDTPVVPVTPDQPTTPETPTPGTPDTPAPTPKDQVPPTPEEPAPAPKDQEVPAEPKPEQSAPAPHASKVDAPAPRAQKVSKESAPKPEQAAAPVHSQELPQTGEGNNILATVGAAIASAASLIGLAGFKRRKNN